MSHFKKRRDRQLDGKTTVRGNIITKIKDFAEKQKWSQK